MIINDEELSRKSRGALKGKATLGRYDPKLAGTKAKVSINGKVNLDIITPNPHSTDGICPANIGATRTVKPRGRVNT